MPVVGLPAAVEGTLEVLLMENQVSSWKVFSEGSKTVVVYVRQLRPPWLNAALTRCSSTDGSCRVNKTDKKRAEENSQRFSQQKERQTDALKNQQASDFIDSGFELFNKTPEACAHEHEYRDVHNTSQHEVFPPPSPPCLDSHEAAAGMFARATFRDNDKNTQLHSGEYRHSVAEAT